MPARPAPRPSLKRVLALIVVPILLVAACASDDGAAEGPSGDDAAASDGETTELSVAVASFDLAVGEDRRLLAGLFGEDGATLAHGDVRFELGYLGEDAGGQAEISQQVTASYLPVPGLEPEASSDQPTLEPVDGRGVYAGAVDLDQAGFWGLRVIAELDDGREVEGQTVFDVGEEPQVPAVGDEAPRTANHVLEDVESGEVAPVAVDSRAQDGADVPDPGLHDTRIPDAIDEGRPVVVIVSTPVYCRTNFCGPLVETLASDAEEFADRAEFIHVEIYEDFEEQQLTQAAADWIQPADGSSGGEPWVFLVDEDGQIAARWDNVLDLDELHGMLEELPPRTAAGDVEADA